MKYSDDPYDDRHKCDRCGTDYMIDEENLEFKYDFVRNVFKNRLSPKLNDFCTPCTEEVKQYIYHLRDIYDLNSTIYKLEKAIKNEKRRIEELKKNKNYRTIKNYARRSRAKRSERIA